LRPNFALIIQSVAETGSISGRIMQDTRTIAAPSLPLLAVLFTATIFLSALLLFFVQPLYTRMVLPQIGGAAAVWTTAMLFF